MNEARFEALYALAQDAFRAGLHSIHGPSHWHRVEAAVIRMAPESGCDLTVGRLFAICHDVCRIHDGVDIDHGPRAAALLRGWQGVHFVLSAEQMDLLILAVAEHTTGQTSPDPTIGTCWDADRLDLGRVGIIPNALFMSTTIGKQLALSAGTD